MEADGRDLEEGAREMGGALGGPAGTVAGGVGKGGGHQEPEEPPPPPPEQATPPPAARAVSGELEIEAVPATPHGEHPFANLSDKEIEAALGPPPRGEATPADFTDAGNDQLVRPADPTQAPGPPVYG